MAERFDLFQNITDRILAALDEGVVPWRKPWQGGEEGLPFNPVTGTRYKGINVWTLTMAAMVKGYSDPRWVTFKGAKSLKGSVRKGEKSEIVVFWKPIQFKSTDKETGEEKVRGSVILRYFRVFNVEQCEGLQLDAIEKPEAASHTPIEEAQAILDGYTDDLSAFEHGGDRAFYAPLEDRVQLPKPECFESPEAYYSVAFHELAHSTGHGTRLDREGVARGGRGFGSHTYSREELVAEFGASYLCGMAGIDRSERIDQSAAYIASWKQVLNDDPRALVVAAGHAEKAARWVLGERGENAAQKAA
jgi:antirestriction protein ArdC